MVDFRRKMAVYEIDEEALINMLTTFDAIILLRVHSKTVRLIGHLV